jgi:signal peptide peptidase SppA
MRYPRLASRLYNVPLMILPDKAEIIDSVFQAYELERHSGWADLREAAAVNQMLADGSTRQADAPYALTDAGIAVLPIYGTLVQRAGPMDAESGMTGYNSLAQQFAAAQADPKVRGIMLEMDSPGGEVAGVFDLAAQIRASAKPVHAYANEAAYSSAYLLASAAQRLSMPATGRVGSVGVMAMHRDMSAADAKRGVKYTPIYAGAHKVEGSPHAPLSADAKARAQAEVDRIYQMFVGAVADHRGISFDAVQGTEAGLLTPGEAMDLGMADGTGSFNEALAILTDASAAPTHFYGHRAAPAATAASLKGTAMDPKDTKQAGGAAPDQNELIAQARAAGVLEANADADKRISAASADAAKAERERVSGILGHAEAEGRRKLAEHFAFKTSNTVEEAAAIMAIAPKEAATAATNPLAAAMANVPNPKVGADLGDMDEASGRAVLDKVVALHRTAAKKA